MLTTPALTPPDSNPTASSLLRRATPEWATTLSLAIDASTSTIPLSSTSLLSTDSAVTIVIDPDTDKQETVIGFPEGSNLVNCVRHVEGVTIGHDANAVVMMINTAIDWNSVVDFLHLAHDATTGLVVAGGITDSAVTTAKIADANVTTAKIAAAAVTRPKIDWSTFSNNMKSASNPSLITPTNSDQNLASAGATISFTVAANCKAQVTISVGLGSLGDCEFIPRILLGGSAVASFSPSAAQSNARASSRGFTAVIPLTTGVNVLSIGLYLASSSSYSIQPNAAWISAIVFGDVTA